MTLSDKTIKALIESKAMVFRPPLDKNQIQPASVDLRLGAQFKIMKTGEAIDTHGKLPNDEDLYYTYNIPEGCAFELKPFSFVLATTKDYMVLPDDVGGMIHGRSSIGRLGVFAENAGWVDPGFEGEITLELFNASPRSMLIYPGDRICQIQLVMLDQMPDNPYQGKYQGQTGATTSLVYQDHMD